VLTYAQMDRRARAIAAELQDRGFGGERVLLVYPPGLDFIAGFFGCLYAGCVAVPTYPPRRRRAGDRFQSIASDSGARVALSTAAAVSQYSAMGDLHAGPGPVQWIAGDEISDATADRWKPAGTTIETLAMLQYTSGSTGRPKGVMLTHGNLCSNSRAIREAFGLTAGDIGTFWLPTYHDMGLVGGILSPLYAGGTNFLLSPAAFLQRPIVWLKAISTYGATISGGPNFAYDLCVRKIDDEQRSGLDLSSWAVAFTGAEPVQAETLERFSEAFAPCGFNPRAFYPCYGMAEATLIVAGGKRGSGPSVREVQLAPGVGGSPESMKNARPRRLVGCGAAVGGSRVLIVDPQTRTEAASPDVGEIWVSGPSVGKGYWQKPQETLHTFHAHLTDGDGGPFLRTGDLGFIADGQLYITGRLDDMMIVRGRNHHPHDIEATARASHPLLEGGYGAAFAIEDGGDHRIVLVHEVARDGTADLQPVLEAIHAAVVEEHGLSLSTIALVRSGMVPKTSSGKVQRRACRAAFMDEELKPLASYPAAPAEPVALEALIHSFVEDTAASDPVESARVLSAVCKHALQLAGVPLSHVTPHTPIASLGLDSLQRLQLVAALEKTFACHLPDIVFMEAKTLAELAGAVQKFRSENAASKAAVGPVPDDCFQIASFPEYVALKNHEKMIYAVAGHNPYFRVDRGGSGSGGVARIDGRNLTNFCAYDYIGLAHHPKVAAAAKEAIDRYGTSAGASRLVSGEKQVHRELEQAIAAFLGTAASIAFVSGHATNVTTIGHLLGRGDLILYDILAHNSIMQGAQLSGATTRAFAHNDWQSLDKALTEVRHRYRRVLIAIEGLYSMDGDYPDLRRFAELRCKHRALLLVDEAHSLGTMGRTGRGIGEHFNVPREHVDLWMGTLSKSLASCGGYIAGSTELVEYLKYTAPGFVYSVGMPPANAAAALAALNVLDREPHRVTRLHELSTCFLKLAHERGLNTGPASDTPVIPVIVGNPVKSLLLSHALFNRGINVQPIMHPAVPEHTDRLRFFITTNHTEAVIRSTIDAVAEESERLS
jgi:8-amino-7-oxononanoate synthase